MHRFVDDPILSAGFSYWLGLPRQADIPARRDLDPLQMPRHILPNIALLEMVEDGTDARVRLAGQEINENFGFNLKGMRMSELTGGDYRAYMLGHLATLIQERGAIYSESAFRWDRGGGLRTRRLMLPLSADQPGVIAMALTIQTWPREKMRGMPFCDAIEGCREVGNTEPRLVRMEEG